MLNEGKFKRFLIVGLLRAFAFQFLCVFLDFFVFHVLQGFFNWHVNVNIVPPLHSSTQSALASFVYVLSGRSLAMCIFTLREYHSVTIF